MLFATECTDNRNPRTVRCESAPLVHTKFISAHRGTETV